MKKTKSNAENQAAFKQRQLDRGLVRLTGVWIHPDDVMKVRLMIKTMNNARDI